MDIVNGYLQKTLVEETLDSGITIQEMRPRAICKDGYSVSIQANKFAYCTPRESGSVTYTSVELGYPSEADELIAGYAEDSDNLTDTIYGYVPINIVSQLLEKHGGLIDI